MTPQRAASPRTGFASCGPGLEPLVEGELRSLGLDGLALTRGGVRFTIQRAEDLWRANLGLRVATRVLLRLGEFRARGRSELSRKVAALPWPELLPPGSLELRCASHRSRLYHTGLIRDAVIDGLNKSGARVGGGAGALRIEPKSGEAPREAQTLFVRFERDLCQLSLDSSGALLHRRGYRTQGARAPLRETLAAALLELCGWAGGCPLVDPFCGSGTLLIEGAWRAAGRPPGLNRSFAFQRWPGFDDAAFERLRAELLARAQPDAESARPVFLGGDRDGLAIEGARANVRRAGLLETIQLQRADVSDLPVPQDPGLLLSNLPYGRRVGRGLRDLYRRLGRHLLSHYRGWRIGLLVGRDSPCKALGLRWEQRKELENGGLPVLLLQTTIRARRAA